MERARITCRFHDLRHTCCTRMLEAGVPFAIVAEIMGWGAAMAFLMSKRYGHIGEKARRQAVAALDKTPENDSKGSTRENSTSAEGKKSAKRKRRA